MSGRAVLAALRIESARACDAAPRTWRHRATASLARSSTTARQAATPARRDIEQHHEIVGVRAVEPDQLHGSRHLVHRDARTGFLRQTCHERPALERVQSFRPVEKIGEVYPPSVVSAFERHVGGRASRYCPVRPRRRALASARRRGQAGNAKQLLDQRSAVAAARYRQHQRRRQQPSRKPAEHHQPASSQSFLSTTEDGRQDAVEADNFGLRHIWARQGEERTAMTCLASNEECHAVLSLPYQPCLVARGQRLLLAEQPRRGAATCRGSARRS